LEGAAQVAEHLLYAPRQCAVAPDRRDPELLDGLVVVARQRGERILAVLAHAEVHEVVRIVFPADITPQVRIDSANDNLVTIVIEKWFESRWQELDPAGHDQAVAGKAPRRCRRRYERRGDRDDSGDSYGGARFHLAILD